MKILYLSYNGLLSHLGRSQVLPYIKLLTDRGYEFFVISFEDEKHVPSEEIDSHFFHWCRFKRVRVLKPLAAFSAVVWGISFSIYLVLRHRIRMIHARSYLPAIMACCVKLLVPNTKVIFDMRGFMLDEYIEGGILSSQSLWLRLGRFFEKQLFQNSDAVVTLTHNSVPFLKQPAWVGERKIPITVIPCCKLLIENGIRRNSHWNNTEQKEIRLIYIGSLGSWYDFPRMLSFFESFQRKFPASTLDILSPQADVVRNAVEESYLRGKIRLATAPFLEVHRHLAIADVGLLFYQPGFSRIGTSPIKFPEYLWAGLAVVATPNIGDLDDLITKYRVGVILDSSDEEVVEKIAMLLRDPQLAQRCRWVVKKFYNIQKGVQQYEEVYQGVLASKC